MKDKRKILARSSGIIATVTTLYIPQLISNVYAEDCGLWSDFQGSGPPNRLLGTRLDCIAGNLFTIAAQATLGLAIVFTLYTIFKTVISQGNAKALEEVTVRWKYTVILIIAAGLGGTLINLGLKFLGFDPFGTLWSNTWEVLVTDLNR